MKERGKVKIRKGLYVGLPFFLHNRKGAQWLPELPNRIRFKTKPGTEADN